MKNTTIIKSIRYLSIFLLAFSQNLKAQNQDGTGFPYFVTFTDGTQPQQSYKPVVPGKTNTATFTTDGLRLTSAGTWQFGSVILADHIFSSDKGIKFEFEYAIYGGNGADGISIFLMDGDLPKDQINIGADGSGLGYAFRYNTLEGLRGAYLGIGLDEYYNSKRAFEGKNGLFGVNVDNYARQFAILRGARGNQDLGQDGAAGYNGYPLLYAIGTNLSTTNQNRGAVLNPITGQYASFQNATLGQFSIDSGGINYIPQNDSDPNYRKAYVELLPNPSGGYNVTLRIKHGTTIETVIDNYHYQTSYNYINTSINANKVLTLDTTPPPNFRIGFAASTGVNTNIHLIKNLGVTMPYAAEATDDSYTECPNTTTTYYPLLNDVAYSSKNGQNPPTASYDNIDLNSFRFLDEQGHVIQNSTNNTYTTSDGTWVYNPNNGSLTFTSAEGFLGVAKMRYDIKGGGPDGTESPYNEEDYRSLPALVQVTVANSASCNKSCVISNKNVTQKILK